MSKLISLVPHFLFDIIVLEFDVLVFDLNGYVQIFCFCVSRDYFNFADNGEKPPDVSASYFKKTSATFALNS